MLLLTHIIIALSSVVLASYLTFRPSQSKLNASYAMIGATLVSGTALIVLSNTPLLHACVSGLVYVSIVTILSVVAQRTLASSRA